MQAHAPLTAFAADRDAYGGAERQSQRWPGPHKRDPANHAQRQILPLDGLVIWRMFQMKRKSTYIALALGLGMTAVLMWLSGFSAGGIPATRAASYNVCPTGPPACDYAVIQDAVDAAKRWRSYQGGGWHLR